MAHSIKDVAKMAGVSSATVSRVLANKPHVRPEVRARVLAVVDEIGYRPNRVASSLRRQTSRVIGVLVSDIRNPFFTAVARAIEDVANEHKMNIFLCNTDEDSEKEKLYLNTLLDENVAGIILSPTSESAADFRSLLDSKIPLVTIDRRIEGAEIDSVLSDNVQSAANLTNYLFDQGYRRIGAVIGLQNSTTGRERMQGVRQAFSGRGMQISDELAVFVEPRERQGSERVRQLLALETPPDIILTGNSRITVGALNAIQEQGLKIPADIGLAGFDETNWMAHAGSGITVIGQPTYEMGKTAADLLFARMEAPDRPPREVVLKGKLIPRGSTQKE